MFPGWSLKLALPLSTSRAMGWENLNGLNGSTLSKLPDENRACT
jgi:hypothetical protein